MADTYFQTSLELSKYAEFIQPILSEVLETAIELQNNTVIITSNNKIDQNKIIHVVKTFSQEMKEEINYSLKEEELENKDWIEEYKKGVKPIEAGEFYIRPSWHPEKENVINIIVDPSLVFGTGEHPTTNLCVVAISKYLQKDMSFLDVGSGSGILALAGATKLALVDFCDTDEQAVVASRENFTLNKLNYSNSWIGSVNLRKKSYDFVVANIVSDILIFLKKDLTKSLNSGGILVLSGILNTYREKVLSSYKDLTLIEDLNSGEWTTLILKKEEDERTE